MILVDICHPAHVHFFSHPMRLLQERGHEVLVTSRIKEIATDLLDEMGIRHHTLSTQANGSFGGLVRELVVRNYRLLRLVRRHRPDVLAAIGGTFVSHVGRLTGTPAVVFYDTENARLQNALTYPLASRIHVPDCYQGWVPERRTTRYRGYHELSYLHPAYFRPDRVIALRNGLAPEGDTFFLRLVSWKANHDIGETGWSAELLRHVVARLRPHGHVLISSEAHLADEFAPLRYSGDPRAVHHVMACCRGYIGESATMASECAVLGVPAVYAALTGRGYTDEQESRYGLVRNVRTLDRQSMDSAMDWLVGRTESDRLQARERLISDTIDVATYAADAIETFARSG